MAEPITFRRTDEQSMLGSTVRELLGRTVDFDAVRTMSTTTDALDRGVWDGLVEMGLLGLHLPEAAGGAGFSALEVAVVAEELGRFVTAVPFVSSVAASATMVAADPEAFADRIASAASGSSIPTLALYEDAHGDLGEPTTSLTPDDGGYVLSGKKCYVTDAVNADVLVVSAMLDGSVAVAVVPTDTNGVVVRAVNALDATRPLASVEFDDVLIPTSDVVAHAESALRVGVDLAVVCLSAEQVGGAQRCMEIAVEYAKSRYQFGRAIGSFQAVKHKCADMLVAVEHARSAAWHAASVLSDPGEAAIAIPMARSVCSDAFMTTAGETIQVLGGIGFTWEHEVHLYFKRAKATSLLFGSVDVWRDRLADAVGI